MRYFLILLFNWIIVLLTMGFLQYIKHFDRVCFVVSVFMSLFLLFNYFMLER